MKKKLRPEKISFFFLFIQVLLIKGVEKRNDKSFSNFAENLRLNPLSISINFPFGD